MKSYLKVFAVAFASFLALFGGVYFGIESFYISDAALGLEGNLQHVNNPNDDTSLDKDKDALDERTALERAVDASNRVNVIAFGLNDSLADTMMFISFDPDLPAVDIISIPRDTYHYVEGFDRNDQKKLNAVYGLREVGGPNGMKHYVSKFLGVPIHHYVRIDLEAVEAIVDTLGGYYVNVPFDMVYDDIYAKPPLHINIKKGPQTLNGSEAVKFLRFRQNNSGTIREGDIQRIPRQQHFVDTMIKKALGSRLPSVINTIIGSRYVRTDMTLEESLSYGLKAASMPDDSINFYTVEGDSKRINGTDYWLHDPAALEAHLYEIYGILDDLESEELDPDALEADEVTP